MKRLSTLLLLIPFFSMSQSSKQDSLWMPFKIFLGEWVGDGDGEPGKGTYERSYQLIFNKKFIEIKNKSTYPPKDNKQGEIHQDIGYISYDKSRKSFILRQFHIEGFVNQYKLESVSNDGKSIVFVTENIENIPNGFRARESYKLINENEFSETFEIADPGKDFVEYSHAVFKRK